MEDVVDGLVDVVGLDDVRLEEAEALRVADVLDVGKRSRLDVVDADDPVAAGQQLVAEMGAEETRTPGDQAG